MISLLTRDVEAGENAALPALLPDLILLYLTPYIGHEAATRVASPAGEEGQARSS